MRCAVQTSLRFSKSDVSGRTSPPDKNATHHGKHMTDNLSLPRMFRSISRVKQSPPNTNKRIIKLGLQEAIPMSVDLIDSRMVRNRYMVGRNPDEFTVALVLVVYDLVSVASACLTGEPELGERGGEGTWVFAEAVGVKDEGDDDREELIGNEALS